MKYKIVFIAKIGKGEYKECNVIPRIGETVNLFYEPMPKVTDIIHFPASILQRFDIDIKESDIDVLITVE